MVKPRGFSLHEARLSFKTKPFKPEHWDALCGDTQARDVGLGEQQQGRVAFGGACATL